MRTAPHIARDTYKGRHTVTRRDASGHGNRTAGWLAAHIGDGNTAVLWLYSGHTADGRLLYVRTRFVARGGQLYGYDSSGVCKVIHPAHRVVGFCFIST